MHVQCARQMHHPRWVYVCVCMCVCVCVCVCVCEDGVHIEGSEMTFIATVTL
jgi:hypothetical protein